MIELAQIMRQFAPAYLKKFGHRIPGIHQKAIHDIIYCRTPQMGGNTYYCDHCQSFHYSYHSCGNRNCNKCQNELAAQWLKKTEDLLLPVDHFMVTFTLPQPLRPLARRHQKLFYHLLMKSAADALQTLSRDSKYVGGLLAMMAVLHSWGRELSYHPHAHFMVAGGGLLETENIWLPCRPRYLVPVEALSVIFRAQFRDALKKEAPAIFSSIDERLWKQAWVVHSKSVGRGEHALKYLAQYIFRPAISNKRIMNLEKGKVTFRYRDSSTMRWKTMTLDALEFIRRYLQHVLPKGFVKVRYYGLYSHRHRQTLQQLKEQMGKAHTQKHEKIHHSKVPRPLTCPRCGRTLLLLRKVPRGGLWPKAPPMVVYDAASKSGENY